MILNDVMHRATMKGPKKIMISKHARSVGVRTSTYFFQISKKSSQETLMLFFIVSLQIIDPYEVQRHCYHYTNIQSEVSSTNI